MTDKQDALAGFAYDCSQPYTRCFEQPHGRVIYTVQGVRQIILLEGECTFYKLLETAFEDRRERNQEPPCEVLLDLTRYAGTVDWNFIRSLAASADWLPPQKVACLTENGLLANYVKILNVLLPGPEYRVFATDIEAAAWLGW